MSCNKILWALVGINLVATAGLAYVTFTPSAVQGSATSSVSGLDEQISAYIKDNPKEIMESVNAYMAGEQDRSEERTKEALKTEKDFLYNTDIHPVLGNPDGTVSIVEFLDYNCGYCKKAYPIIEETIAKHKNVRVILIEIPILHETSALAAHWALAAKELGHYDTFHKELMTNTSPITEELLTGFATKAGIDAAKLKELANSDGIKAQVSENLAKAQAIGINGTPGFIIGDNIIRGYVEYPAMKAAIEQTEKTGQ